MIGALLALTYVVGFILMSRVIRATSQHGYEPAAAFVACLMWPLVFIAFALMTIYALILLALRLDGKARPR